MIAACKTAGVVVSPGKSYHVIEGEKGWARLTFSVPPEKLDEALRRLEVGLKLINGDKMPDKEPAVNGSVSLAMTTA